MFAAMQSRINLLQLCVLRETESVVYQDMSDLEFTLNAEIRVFLPHLKKLSPFVLKLTFKGCKI